MYDFVHWVFCDFSVGSPSPTLSPVNGFFVVGVVIVFSPFSPFCTTSSVPGFNFGSNSRFYQTESLFSMIGSPSTGPYFVTSSTGGVTTSPVSGFLIPGLPGTSSSLPFGAFGSNSFYDLVVLSHRHNVRFRPLGLLWSFSVGSPLPTLSPVNGFFVVGVVIVFSIFTFLYDFFCTRF